MWLTVETELIRVGEYWYVKESYRLDGRQVGRATRYGPYVTEAAAHATYNEFKATTKERLVQLFETILGTTAL